MKLYEVPRKSYIRLDGDTFFFDHVNGIYSYCLDMKGNVVHLVAWAEVELANKEERAG
jgi:hypothetical protein